MTGTLLSLNASKASPTMKSNYSEFILKYFFSCIESFYKTDWKMLKNLKRLIFDYEVIAQETFTATWQNFPLKSKLCLMYPFVIESKCQVTATGIEPRTT